jgi:hypothetical protein
MEFWDFDEDINYTLVRYKDSQFKVLNAPNKKTAAKLLYQSRLFINTLSYLVKVNLNNVKAHLKEMSIVFLSIHPNNYDLQEMQVGTRFEGLNKPKNIHYNKYLPSLGKDKLLKANNRRVFLKLRHANGKLKDFKELIPLIIHEIAHTGCNHVRWRDDDHGSDFQLFESYLYYLSSSIYS